MRRIRDYAHASWVDALTPIFAPNGGKNNEALVQQLAVLGRALTDGLSVTNSFDDMSYSSQVAPFVSLIRGSGGAAGRRGETQALRRPPSTRAPSTPGPGRP